MAADYDINLARSTIHQAVGNLIKAQDYLNRAYYETAADTASDVAELGRIIERIERLNRRLVSHADVALSNERLNR